MFTFDSLPNLSNLSNLVLDAIFLLISHRCPTSQPIFDFFFLCAHTHTRTRAYIISFMATEVGRLGSALICKGFLTDQPVERGWTGWAKL